MMARYTHAAGRTALVLAIACMAAAASQASPRAERTREGLERVTLMLDWMPNVNHVGLFVARDQGYFAREGLEVTIIEPGEVYAAAAVAGGQADFGIDFQENLTLLRSEGVPLVSVAAILQTNTSGFAVRSGEGIRSPADFAGLAYGTFNSPYEQPTIDALLRCAGAEAGSVRFVTAGMDLLAMLQQRQADLVWIFYGTQGFQARRIGLSIDYFPLNEYTDCIPDYYSPVVIASERTLQERPELVMRFVRALSAAHRGVMEAPAAAARTLAQAVPELDRSELESSVPWVASHMVLGAPAWGYQEAEVWQRYADWLAAAGLIQSGFRASEAFTNAFIPLD